ncbi:MAG: 3-ketoacyl-ACP reductase [Verrucomicrobiales bacterium]|nr:3-ketoacyl-ACP reductase [Verrucomicrobiales bacterium]
MNPMAIITGASRGIGRGIARRLAMEGWDLVLNYARNEAAARDAAEECRHEARQMGREVRVEVFGADIAEGSQRESLVRFAKTTFAACQLLVNNAGVAPVVRADILDAGEDSFDRLISTNLKGPYFLTQQVARWMLEIAGPEKPPATKVVARIVFVSSISAYTASVNRGDYCVSKAGVAMLCKLFAARLAEHGIHVFEVRPGVIATDMTGPVKEKYDRLIADGLTPIRRWGSAEDVGKAVAAIAQGFLPFSTGEVINVDGGFHLRTL